MTERPEYVHCIADPRDAEVGLRRHCTSLCGKIVYGFIFTGLDHAYCTAMSGSRFQICPGCTEAAHETLINATWSNE